MDALTSVLHVLRLQPNVFHRLRLFAPWGMRLSAVDGAAFHVVEQGCCWLRQPGQADPLQLCAGDLIVVANTPDYALAANPQEDAVPVRDLLQRRDERGEISLSTNGRGAATTLLCGEFRSEHGALMPLFSVLPPLIHIQGHNGQPVEWLAPPLEFITSEVEHGYPGKDTVISRLMDILFIMVIRYWIVHQPVDKGGWFRALYHPQIGEVLGYIHRQPEQAWTVETLAAADNLSRSSLATQFTAMVGESPGRYLTRWRMQLAANWLVRHHDLTLEEIAQRVGYESPYAFSKAFKRLVGVSPSEYRTRYLAATDADY